MIEVTIDTRAVRRMLTAVQQKQLLFAISIALNAVAFESQKEERSRFASVFDHPRPFTQRSALVTKATKAVPSVTIFVRPEVEKYLDPFEFGGVHVTPGSKQLVPVDLGAGVRLDQFGQFTKAARSRLNALADDPASNVFFGTVHGIRGYWLRPKMRKAKTGQAQRRPPLVLIAEVKVPVTVTKHLNFIPTVSRDVLAAYPAAFQRALTKALASAR